ncbi:MAG: hypothetical protein WB783_03585 [Arenicellales bacterium]
MTDERPAVQEYVAADVSMSGNNDTRAQAGSRADLTRLGNHCRRVYQGGERHSIAGSSSHGVVSKRQRQTTHGSMCPCQACEFLYPDDWIPLESSAAPRVVDMFDECSYLDAGRVGSQISQQYGHTLGSKNQ